MPDTTSPAIDKHDFEVLADFRYQIRKFERFSEEITQRYGVTPLQYLLLLQIKGYPGREWATVGELAERLQAHHHGTVALVSRCEARGLIERRRSLQDKRHIEIHLLGPGEALLQQLAHLHRRELLSLHGRFVVPERGDFDAV